MEPAHLDVEPTGRYGGLNKREMRNQVEVQVKNANEVVQIYSEQKRNH